MRPATLFRVALAGTRTDVLRVVLTAVSASLATLAALAAATVMSINDWSGRYSPAVLNDPRLRVGVVVGLTLLMIPVLALAAQCSRLGAPGRDRRLAGFRLAGATPRQVVRIAAAETGVASLVGAGVGLVAYQIGRLAWHHTDPHRQLPLPTDVRVGAAVVGMICLGIPLLASGAATVLLRRVVVGPFGVVRSTHHGRPGAWPTVLVALGVAAFVVAGAFDGLKSEAYATLLFLGGLSAAAGIALGVGWVSYTTGRALHRYARRPATLIAARRLMDDPWSGSRMFGTLLVAVVFGAGAAAYRAFVVAEVSLRDEVGRLELARRGEEYVADEYLMKRYTQAVDYVDAAVAVAAAIAAVALLVALVERLVSGRQAAAALVAAGVPRRTLAKAALWQVAVPAVPAIVLAVAVGAVMTRGLNPTVKAGGYSTRGGLVPTVTRPVPVPWEHLAVVAASGLSLVLAMVGLSLLFLRSSTDLTELRTT